MHALPGVGSHDRSPDQPVDRQTHCADMPHFSSSSYARSCPSVGGMGRQIAKDLKFFDHKTGGGLFPGASISETCDTQAAQLASEIPGEATRWTTRPPCGDQRGDQHGEWASDMDHGFLYGGQFDHRLQRRVHRQCYDRRSRVARDGLC